MTKTLFVIKYKVNREAILKGALEMKGIIQVTPLLCEKQELQNRIRWEWNFQDQETTKNVQGSHEIG